MFIFHMSHEPEYIICFEKDILTEWNNTKPFKQRAWKVKALANSNLSNDVAMLLSCTSIHH